MALNQLGLGLTITAKDLATETVKQVETATAKLGEANEHAAKAAEEMGKKEHEAAKAAGEAAKAAAEHHEKGKEATEKHGKAAEAAAESHKKHGEAEHEAGEAAHDGAEKFLMAKEALEKIHESGERAHETLERLAERAEKFEKLETTLTRVALKTDEAKFPMEKMQKTTGELAVEFGRLQATEADAYMSALGAGAKDAAQAQQFLTAANVLATTKNIELGQATAALSEIMRAFKLQTKDAAELSGVLYKSGVADVEVFNHIAPVAARAGLTYQQMAAALKVLHQQGKDGRKYIMELTTAIEDIRDPTLATAAVTKLLGEQFNVALEKMEGAGEEAEKAAKKLTSTSDQIKALKDVVDNIIGEAFKPFVDKFEEITKKAYELFLNFAEHHPKLVQFGVGLAAAAAILAIAASAVIGFTIALTMLDLELLPVIGLVLVGMIPVMMQLAVLFAPIIAGVYALYQAYDKNLGGIATTLEHYYHVAETVVDGIVQLFQSGQISGATAKELSKAENGGLLSFVMTIYMWGSRVVEFFESIGRGFQVVMDKMGPTFDELSNAFTRLGNALSFLFSGDNDPKKNAASFDEFADTGARVGVVLGQIVDYAVRAVIVIVDFVAQIIAAATAIYDELEPSLDQILDSLGELWGTIKNDLWPALQSIIHAFDSTSSTIKDTKDETDSFQDAMSAVEDILWLVHAAIEVVSFVISVASVNLRIMGDLFNAIFSDGSRAAIDLVNVFEAVAMAIANVLDKLNAARGKTTHFAADVKKGFADLKANSDLDFRTDADKASAKPVRSTERKGKPVSAAATEGQANSKDELASLMKELQAMQAGGEMGKGKGEGGSDHVHVYVDGEKVADAVAKRHRGGGARSFTPQPIPGG